MKRQQLFENLSFMSTKNFFKRKKFFTFHLNYRFVTENLRRHNLYVIIQKKHYLIFV